MLLILKYTCTSFRPVQGPYVPQNQSTTASDTDLVAMEHMRIAEIRHTVTFNCNLRVKLKLKWL